MICKLHSRLNFYKAAKKNYETPEAGEQQFNLILMPITFLPSYKQAHKKMLFLVKKNIIIIVIHDRIYFKSHDRKFHSYHLKTVI